MVGKEISKDKKKKERHQPLAAQIQQEAQTWQEIKPRKKYIKKDNEEPEVIEGNLSEKILKRARKQLEEDEEDNQIANNNRNIERLDIDNKSDDEDEMSEDEEGYNLEEVEIAEEDERALEMFMSKDNTKRTTLADVIMEKIREKESGNMEPETSFTASLDPKVVQVYQGVGELLSRYTAGKVPKAFKIIPALSNWEEILFLTNPDQWTPNAMRVATRIFASNLNAKMAQRFYNLVLLPRVLEDIKRNKKLNFHLYLSLKKALYKPAAFFKGILLPLCESGKCSLREASIIGSVLVRVSIPVLHSSAAILKIAEMQYSGANSLFLKILLNKKYALPYRVINAVVNHFSRFLDDPRPLPILWYQALLTFVERYRTDLLPEQKENLKQVIKQKDHFYFSEEIRRQLNSGDSREQNNEMKD